MPKKYSDEFKADAVAVYLEHPGATYKEIAADLGLSSETLSRFHLPSVSL